MVDKSQIAIGSYIAQAMGDGARAEITVIQSDKEQLPTPHQAPRLPDHFVGRERELLFFRDKIIKKREGKTVTLAALHGMGGVGKSTLAAALVFDKSITDAFPDGVLWASLGEKPDILSILGGFAMAFGYNVQGYSNYEERSKAVRSLLYDRKVLVVLDDVWSIDPLRALLVAGPESFTIITTRHLALAKAIGASILEIDVLNESESLDLIAKWLDQRLDDNELQYARLLAELTGYLPLGLEIASAQVVEIGWDSVLAWLQTAKQKLSFLELDEAQTKRESVRLSFQMSYNHLTTNYQEKFMVLAVFAEGAPLDLEVVKTIWGMSIEETEVMLNRFVGRGLIKRLTSDTYSLHTLLHEFVKELSPDEQLGAVKCLHSQGYFEFSKQYINRPDKLRASLRNLRLARMYALANASFQLVIDFTQVMHDIFYEWGHWDDNVEWVQDGIEAANKIGNKKIEATLLKDLGYIYRQKGESSTALTVLENAKVICVENNDLAGLGAVIENIGIVLKNEGKLDKARELYIQGLQYRSQAGDMRGVAQSLNNLAEISLLQGNYDQAIKYGSESLRIREEIKVPIFWLTPTLANIGAYYYLTGDTDRALEYYFRVKEIRERIGAEDRLAGTLDDIGKIYLSKGDYENAQAYISRSVAIQEQLGNWSGLIHSYNDLGQLNQAQGNYSTAIEYYKLCKRIFEEKGGALYSYSTVLANLAYAHEGLKEYKVAIHIMQQALSLQESMHYRDCSANQMALERMVQESAE